MANNIEAVAIIGGGPAGSTLATLLARQGFKVGLFQIPKRPALIVGESLLPSVIPILRLLDVENEIKAFSTFKPGATICLGPEEEVSFDFDLAATRLEYAYNVPRDLFDQTILNAARQSGAAIFNHRAKVELDATGQPQLSAETLAASNGFFHGKVDLIVDATGRSRLFPKMLDLPSKQGQRNDLALFAHLENVQLTDPGNIHVDRFEYGWGWRIPLPGRVSLGVVLAPKHLEGLGKTREEQYDNFIKTDPIVQQFTTKAKRISPVVTYTNYQWKSQQFYGKGWALAGDSAGFVDPVFSTGLYLAMQSGVSLAKAVEKGTPKAFQKYQDDHLREIASWQTIIDTWYDGRLFTLFRMGQMYKKSFLGRFLNPHMTKHVTRVFTGEIRSGSYSHRLLRFMTKYGLYNEDTCGLVIH